MSEYDSNDKTNKYDGLDDSDQRDIIDATRAFEGDAAADEISNEVRQEMKNVFEQLAHAYALQEVSANDPEFQSLKETHFQAIIESGTTVAEAQAMLIEVQSDTHDEVFEIMDFDDDDDSEIYEDDDEHFLGDPDNWKRAA